MTAAARIARCGPPRLSKAFADRLKKKDPAKGRAGYSDRTVNRILAHLKTLAKWIHKLKPFPLGNPMAKIKLMPIGNGLEIERAISPAERRRCFYHQPPTPTATAG